MSEDLMDYEKMAEKALRQVVRQSLERASSEGLPGEHHFFIAFKTTYPGVQIADSLKETYPEEMTIVLQNRFWDLEAHENHFEVELTFNGVPQHLYIPYAAVRTFYDPSVEFGLQFHVDDTNEEANEYASKAAPDDSTVEAIHPMSTAPMKEPKESPSQDEGAAEAQVVSLDAFRNK